MSKMETTPEPGVEPAQAGPIYRLIYRSRSCMEAASADAELARIFNVARASNKAAGITGALMMNDSWFAQVLEGPEDKVRTLFEHIKADTRHEAVELRSQGIVPDRAFGRWAMAEVQDQGERDLPMLATANGLSEGAPWTVTPAQTPVLAELRLLTRGYGKGA